MSFSDDTEAAVAGHVVLQISNTSVVCKVVISVNRQCVFMHRYIPNSRFVHLVLSKCYTILQKVSVFKRVALQSHLVPQICRAAQMCFRFLRKQSVKTSRSTGAYDSPSLPASAWLKSS